MGNEKNRNRWRASLSGSFPVVCTSSSFPRFALKTRLRGGKQTHLFDAMRSNLERALEEAN